MYYKLVSVFDGSLWSYASRANERYTVEYKENESVSPKVQGTKLFVFELLSDLKTFLHKEMRYWGDISIQVWECEVTNPAPLFNVGISDLDYFWANPTNIGWPAPKGTIGVDSVKLTKRVKP